MSSCSVRFHILSYQMFVLTFKGTMYIGKKWRPGNAAFYQGLHCLLSLIRSSKKERHFFLIIAFDTSIYAMDHSDLIVCSFMENLIGPK